MYEAIPYRGYIRTRARRTHGTTLAWRRDRIAYLWSQTPRRTVAEIAEDVGVSVEVAFRHLRKLRQAGRIQGHRPEWANQARNRRPEQIEYRHAAE